MITVEYCPREPDSWTWPDAYGDNHMEPSSGNNDFDHMVRTRFVLDECRVKMLPDNLPGKFSVGMTPEQTEFLAQHLQTLAAEARKSRGKKFPGLYPEDAT